jgi:hypothetical protein
MQATCAAFPVNFFLAMPVPSLEKTQPVELSEFFYHSPSAFGADCAECIQNGAHRIHLAPKRTFQLAAYVPGDAHKKGALCRAPQLLTE